MKRRVLAAAVAAAVLLVACSDSESGSGGTTAGSTTATSEATTATSEARADGTLTVPEEFATIQSAVDAAQPGDLVLVSPGTYNEAVQVGTDDLTIRGLDRNTVVLDGQLELDNGVRVLGAKRVTIENMTAMNYTKNGFFWTGVDGYHGSYLTTYRNGSYGVYVFDSVNGQIDHIFATGSPDAGVYIGACYPCNAVVTDVVSEYNGIGYSGTDSGGELYVINSVFHNNRVGMVTNTSTYELCYPQREATFAGNLVYSNSQPDTPAIDAALLGMGNGIVIAGGIRDVVFRNMVYDHDRGGIAVTPYPDEDPNDSVPGSDQWDVPCSESRNNTPVAPGDELAIYEPYEARVTENVLENNRLADLILATVGIEVSTSGSCFAGNTFTTSAPLALESLALCTATGAGVGEGDWTAGALDILAWIDSPHPPSVDWKTATLPELQPQENMPDAATAPAHPATDVPMKVDLASIKVPAKPA